MWARGQRIAEYEGLKTIALLTLMVQNIPVSVDSLNELLVVRK